MSRFQILLNILASMLNLSILANLKPLSEFLHFKRLSKPANFSEVKSRVSYNLGHFSSNYVVVFVVLGIYSLLTNWLLLLVAFPVVGGIWGIGNPDVRGFDISANATSSQLYTAFIGAAIILGFFASPFSTIL